MMTVRWTAPIRFSDQEVSSFLLTDWFVLLSNQLRCVVCAAGMSTAPTHMAQPARADPPLTCGTPRLKQPLQADRAPTYKDPLPRDGRCFVPPGSNQDACRSLGGS